MPFTEKMFALGVYIGCIPASIILIIGISTQLICIYSKKCYDFYEKIEIKYCIIPPFPILSLATICICATVIMLCGAIICFYPIIIGLAILLFGIHIIMKKLAKFIDEFPYIITRKEK